MFVGFAVFAVFVAFAVFAGFAVFAVSVVFVAFAAFAMFAVFAVLQKKKGCFDLIWLPQFHTSSASFNTVETHWLVYIPNSD